MGADDIRAIIREAMAESMEELRVTIREAIMEAFAEIKPAQMSSNPGDNGDNGDPISLHPEVLDFMQKIYSVMSCVPWPPCYPAMLHLGSEIFTNVEIGGEKVNAILEEIADRTGYTEDQIIVKLFREMTSQMLAPMVKDYRDKLPNP